MQTAPDPTAEGMLGKKKVVANPSQAELMKDALAAFAKWQAAVLKRMENIVAARESGPMQNQASSGRSYSRPGNNKQAIGPRVFRPRTVPWVVSRPRRVGWHSHVTPIDGPPLMTTAPREVKPSVAEADATFRRLYPPTPTPLRSLPAEKNALLLHSMLLLVLSLESYAAYSRVLVLNMASSLSIPLHVLAEDEVRAAKGLSRLINASPKDELAPKKPRNPNPCGAGRAARPRLPPPAAWPPRWWQPALDPCLAALGWATRRRRVCWGRWRTTPIPSAPCLVCSAPAAPAR